MAAIMGVMLLKSFLVQELAYSAFIVLGSLQVHCCFRAALAHVKPVLLPNFN
jgi:hypothetical protein